MSVHAVSTNSIFTDIDYSSLPYIIVYHKIQKLIIQSQELKRNYLIIKSKDIDGPFPTHFISSKLPSYYMKEIDNVEMTKDVCALFREQNYIVYDEGPFDDIHLIMIIWRDKGHVLFD